MKKSLSALTIIDATRAANGGGSMILTEGGGGGAGPCRDLWHRLFSHTDLGGCPH